MLKGLLLGFRAVLLALGGNKHVALENVALRHQIVVLKRDVGRPRLYDRDRLFWVVLARMWRDWRKTVLIVQPETVIDWQRRRFKRYWRKLSQRKGPGRPCLPVEVRRLIRAMAAANPLWGAPRIHGELLKLGFDISERTVSRWMPRRPPNPSQTWKTFLDNHVGQLVSVDFFTVATLQLRVLFVFVVLVHDRRRVVHFNVTEHPTAEWTAQQIIEAFPDDTAPRYLIRDRDGIYGHWFDDHIRAMGIKPVRTSARSPWQNGYAERMIGSIRRECLNHVIAINERHLRRILKRYIRYYLDARTHLALEKDAPNPRPIQPPGSGRIVQISEVGGLHHRYERQAAESEPRSRQSTFRGAA